MVRSIRPAPRIVTMSRPHTAEAKRRRAFVPGQMIIRLKARPVSHLSMAMSTRSVSTSALAALSNSVGQPLEYIQNNMGLKSIKPLFAAATPKPARGVHIAAAGAKASALASVVHADDSALSGINLVEVDAAEVTASRLKHLEQSDAIEFVERVPAHWLVAPRRRSRKGTDARINKQWALQAMGWFDSKRPSAGAIDVAVLDTGVDQNHPDLKGAIASYETNGFSKRDIVGHGTHVCGIIGAITNNALGIAGVADCKIHVWKVFSDTREDGDYYVDTEAFLASLRAAADSGARVMNLSIGGEESSRAEQILFNYVANKGVLAVAAMGNEFEEGNPIEYPAAYDRVLPVGAIGANLARAEFSNTGKHISVSAPGVAILSTYPMKSVRGYRTETAYGYSDGTSMATPHVVAAAALLLAKKPLLSPQQIRRRIERTARKLAEMKGKRFTKEHGHGNVYLPKLLE